MKLLKFEIVPILAGLDQEIKSWSENIAKIDKLRDEHIQKMQTMIKEAELSLNTP